MAETGSYRLGSLRPSRMEGGRVMFALAISLLAHLLLFSGYELSREIPLLHRLLWVAAQQRQMVQPQKQEEPLEFVTVRTPSTEVPKNTKYFSNRNAVAANPDANKDTGQPKLDGKQTDIVDTRDESQYQPSKSPTGADLHQQNSSQDSRPAKPSSSAAGDLTLSKPDQTPQQTPRPRTLKEAYQQMANRIPTMTMKEEGGVKNRDEASFDVKLTGFGDYDARFIEAVRQNWFDELDSHKFSEDHTGKVVLVFDLNYDGSVSQMRVVSTSAGDLLAYVCEKAVLEGAPYSPWSEDMRMTLGSSLECTFTFIY